MGEYCFLSQNFHEANQYYLNVEDNINFESSVLYSSIGESNLEIGNFKKSLSFFLKTYNLNQHDENLIILIYNLYIILGYFDNAESFLIQASMNNRENIYLFDTLFYHFLNKKDYLEAIEVLADIYSIDNSEIISKSMNLYDACNDKKLIFDILDDHYIYYQNINFIRIKFIFSHLFDDYNAMKDSFSILESNNKTDLNNTLLFCQKLFLKKDFNQIFILLEPYYLNQKISLNGLKLFFNATVELNLKDYFLEISEYAYQHYSDNPLTHEMFINSLIKNNEFDKALKIIQFSKSQFPDYYSFNVFEAKLYEISQDYNKSVFIYNKILKDYPDLIDIKYNLAQIYNITQNYSLCDSIFLELLNIDSNNINFLNDFSFIIANREISNKEELIYAIKLIEYGLAIENNNPKLLDTYGWLNYKLEKYNIALEYINKSLSIKRDSIALEHLIETLKITNKTNKVDEIQSNFFDSK